MKQQNIYKTQVNQDSISKIDSYHKYLNSFTTFDQSKYLLTQQLKQRYQILKTQIQSKFQIPLIQQQTKKLLSTINVIKNLNTTLVKLWKKQNIDHTYCHTFTNALKLTPLNKMIDFLKSQIVKTQTKNSAYFIITKDIQIRNRLVKQLKMRIQKITQTEYLTNNFLEQICKKISALRLKSLIIIQNIKQWQKQIQTMTSLRSKPIQTFQQQNLIFYHNKQNYLENMINDTKFLKKSFLNKFIAFSNNPDPLLIYPYKRIINQQKSFMQNYDCVKKLFDLKFDFAYRLNQAETILEKYIQAKSKQYQQPKIKNDIQQLEKQVFTSFNMPKNLQNLLPYQQASTVTNQSLIKSIKYSPKSMSQNTKPSRLQNPNIQSLQRAQRKRQIQNKMSEKYSYLPIYQKNPDSPSRKRKLQNLNQQNIQIPRNNNLRLVTLEPLIVNNISKEKDQRPYLLNMKPLQTRNSYLNNFKISRQFSDSYDNKNSPLFTNFRMKTDVSQFSRNNNQLNSNRYQQINSPQRNSTSENNNKYRSILKNESQNQLHKRKKSNKYEIINNPSKIFSSTNNQEQPEIKYTAKQLKNEYKKSNLRGDPRHNYYFQQKKDKQGLKKNTQIQSNKNNYKDQITEFDQNGQQQKYFKRKAKPEQYENKKKDNKIQNKNTKIFESQDSGDKQEQQKELRSQNYKKKNAEQEFKLQEKIEPKKKQHNNKDNNKSESKRFINKRILKSEDEDNQNNSKKQSKQNEKKNNGSNNIIQYQNKKTPLKNILDNDQISKPRISQLRHNDIKKPENNTKSRRLQQDNKLKLSKKQKEQQNQIYEQKQQNQQSIVYKQMSKQKQKKNQKQKTNKNQSIKKQNQTSNNILPKIESVKKNANLQSNITLKKQNQNKSQQNPPKNIQSQLNTSKKQNKSNQQLNKSQVIKIIQKKIQQKIFVKYLSSFLHQKQDDKYFYSNVDNFSNFIFKQSHILQININGQESGVIICEKNAKLNIMLIKAFVFKNEKYFQKSLKQIVKYIFNEDPSNQIYFHSYLKKEDQNNQKFLRFETKIIECGFYKKSEHEIKQKIITVYSIKRADKFGEQKLLQDYQPGFLGMISNLLFKNVQRIDFQSDEIQAFTQNNYYGPYLMIILMRQYYTDLQQYEKIIKNNDLFRNFDTNINKKQNQIIKKLIKAQKFLNIQQLNKKLQTQKYQTYLTKKIIQNLSLTKIKIRQILQFPFFTQNNYLYFTLNQKYSNYAYIDQTHILILNMPFKNFYICCFKKTDNISCKLGLQTLNKHKKQIRSVKQSKQYKFGIHYFSKQIYGKIMSINNNESIYGNLNISFQWRDYLMGKIIRSVDIQSYILFDKNMSLGVYYFNGQEYGAIFQTFILQTDLIFT